MILVTINVDRQDLIELGISGEGEDVECAINPSTITLLYPSYDEDKEKMGTKVHLSSGENIWCYEGFYDVLSKVKDYNEKLK